MVSSTYCRHEIPRFKGPTFWTRPHSCASVRIHDSTSILSIKKYGERGSPCLNSCLYLKGVPDWSLIRTEEKPDLRSDSIYPHHLIPNPRAWRTLRRKVQSNESKALTKSSLRKNADQLYWAQAINISWAVGLSMKADCKESIKHWFLSEAYGRESRKWYWICY